MQFECSYYEADAAVLALLKQGKLVEKAPPESQPGTDSDRGVRRPAKTVAELQHVVQEQLLWGMQRAAACDVPWAVSNGAVYCWNAHLPAIQSGRCALGTMSSLRLQQILTHTSSVALVLVANFMQKPISKQCRLTLLSALLGSETGASKRLQQVLLQLCRYAQVGEVLLQAANLLVAIEAQHIPQKLLRNLTVAAMKAVKHLALIAMISNSSSGVLSSFSHSCL